MKIAVCMSGNFRYHDEIHNHWKTLYSQYDCDLFLHTWDFLGLKTTTDTTKIQYRQYDYSKLLLYSIPELKEKFNFKLAIIEKYYPEFYNKFNREIQPLKILREYSDFFASVGGQDPRLEEDFVQNDEVYTSAFSMWYKRWKCFELMHTYSLENHIKYDLVINTRPDVFVAIDFEKINLNLLTIPAKLSENQRVLEDRAVIGPKDLIREYCSLYPRFMDLNKTWKYGDTNFSADEVLYKYLNKLNIPYEVSNEYFTFGHSRFPSELKSENLDWPHLYPEGKLPRQ